MTTPTIYQALADVKREIGAVGKNQRNAQQGFNFRGIDDVVNAAAPALDKHGVIPAPVLQDIEYTTVEVGQKRTPMAHVRVRVTYQFFAPDATHIDVTVPGEAMDSGDKGTAKAMSVAYRIALLQALNLPTHDEDPDANSYERSPAVTIDDEWFRRAVAMVGGLDAKGGQRLWQECEDKVAEGQVSLAMESHLKGLMRARAAELKETASELVA